MNPPPLNQPQMQPPPPPPVPRKANENKVWIIVLVVGFALFIGVGIFAAILIPTVSKVRDTARRTVDSSNLREIAKAALIYANDNAGNEPPTRISSDGIRGGTVPATIYGVAAALAREGGLNDATLWFAVSDRGTGAKSTPDVNLVLDVSRHLDAGFAKAHGFAWDFATGLSTNMPSTTPVAWTRGLDTTGSWGDKNGVYGGDGGYIVFLGGNVQFFRDLRTNGGALIKFSDGTRTANILEALPSTAHIVGDGPGTLDGKSGLAPTR